MERMAEGLLKQRSTYKGLITKSAKTLNRLIKERNVNLIQQHGIKMKSWFSDFDQTNDAYTETLTNEPDIAAASSYYDTVYDTYMDQLDSLNSAMDSLTVQAPVVVENTVPESTLSAIYHRLSICQGWTLSLLMERYLNINGSW